MNRVEQLQEVEGILIELKGLPDRNTNLLQELIYVIQHRLNSENKERKI